MTFDLGEGGVDAFERDHLHMAYLILLFNHGRTKKKVK